MSPAVPDGVVLSDWSLVLLLAVTAATLLLLRALAWRGGVLLIGRTVALAPRLGRSRAWVRARPLRAWLRARCPRFYRALAARLSPSRFSGLPMTLIAAAACYLVALSAGLVSELFEADELIRFDEAVDRTVAVLRAPWLLTMFLWLTTLGSFAALFAVAVTASAFLWADRRPGFILPLWVTFLGCKATTYLGKYLIARERPVFLPDVATAEGPSFPSAHSSGAVAVLGFVAFTVVRDLPGRRARFECVFWTAVLIMLIAFSRVLLSVHFASDVACGLIVGGFWLLAGVTLVEWHRVGGGRAP